MNSIDIFLVQYGLAAIFLLMFAKSVGVPIPIPADLIVLTAFFVVLGTLAIQGLTLKLLLRILNLQDDDPIGREVAAARERALDAALASFGNDQSPKLRNFVIS